MLSGRGSIKESLAALPQLPGRAPAADGGIVPSTHTFPEIRGQPTPRGANASAALGLPSFPYRNR